MITLKHKKTRYWTFNTQRKALLDCPTKPICTTNEARSFLNDTRTFVWSIQVISYMYISQNNLALTFGVYPVFYNTNHTRFNIIYIQSSLLIHFSKLFQFFSVLKWRPPYNSILKPVLSTFLKISHKDSSTTNNIKTSGGNLLRRMTSGFIGTMIDTSDSFKQ